MNHQEFRMFVKQISKEAIKAYNIKPAYFKAVCMVLSMYGDYETGTNIRPSWLTIANEAGVDRKTAMKVRDILLAHDILIQVGNTEANIAIYKFGSVVHLKDSPGQLSIVEEQLSITDDQLSTTGIQLSTIDGQNITYNITIDTKRLLQEDSSESSKSQEDWEDDPSLDFKGISPEEMYRITDHLWA